MKRKIISCSVLMFFVCIYISGVTMAASQSDINNLNQQKKNAQNDLSNIKEEKSSVQSEVDSLNEEISSIESSMDELQVQIDSLNNEITQKQNEVTQCQKDIEEKNELLKKRLVAMYKTGNTSFLDVLLSSKSYLDLFTAYDAVKEITKADTDLIDDITEKKNKIETDKKELETKKTELDNAQASKKAKSAALTVKKQEKASKVNQLSADEKAKQTEIDNYAAQIKKVEDEIAAVAKAAASASKNKNGSQKAYSGGKLKFPLVSYSYVSQYYGYRPASATGGVGSTNHKGWDIAASDGTTILAAHSGTVKILSNSCSHNYAKYKRYVNGKKETNMCGCGGGYGNYFEIVGDDNITTLYAHCSSINVSNGQRVSAGQAVGTVGSTGNSTGFHLHFGVLLNGNFDDPANYLS